MKPTKKLALIAALSCLLTSLALLSATVAWRKDRTFEAPFPDLRATLDPSVIERGRYLALGPAHCVDCHADPNVADDGPPETKALSGGLRWELPVGTFFSRNITPEPETGIGRYTDRELARLLRYGVRPDGRVALPFMRFGNLADDDLVAILSYLRSLTPVKHSVPENQPNALGKALLAFVIEPVGPTSPPQKNALKTPTPEYGRYLAHDVAGCVNCHTKMDLRTGALVGPIFAGGAEHPAKHSPEKLFIAPNLTPHPTDGWLNGWSEEAFVTRLRGGPVHADSPMPWGAFQRVSEDDARAIFRYLRTVPAAPGGPNPKTRDVLAAVTP